MWKARLARMPFAGWVIVLASMTIMIVNSGSTYYGNSIFLVPLQHEFGTSRTAISQVFAMINLVAAACMPLVGILIDRYGARRTVMLGAIAVAAGFFLLSRISSLWQLYAIILAMQGAALRFIDPLPYQTVVGRWFIRMRGRAMGLVMVGPGIGGLIVPPVMGLIIERFGWRAAYMLGGVLILGVAVPAALLIYNRPEDLGQRPFGESELTPAAAAARMSGATFKQAIGSSQFRMLGAVAVLCYVTSGVVSLQLPAILQETGLRVSESALFFGVMLGVSAVGRLAAGALMDRYPGGRVQGTALCGMGLAALLLLRPDVPALRVMFVVAYGLCMGGAYTSFAVATQELFGVRAFGRIYSIITVMVLLGTTAGNYLGGRLYDLRGSYGLAVGLASAMAFSAGLLALLVRAGAWREELSPALVAGAAAERE
jgi:MFS transporter, OFA family, oxalate/formate antiporter